jgi:hypothetical protein
MMDGAKHWIASVWRRPAEVRLTVHELPARHGAVTLRSRRTGPYLSSPTDATQALATASVF